MFKTIFSGHNKIREKHKKTWGVGLPANASPRDYGPCPSNESGFYSYKSEVYCIVGSNRLFGLTEVTT